MSQLSPQLITHDSCYADIIDALESARQFLDMDVAYLSEIRRDHVIFRAVSHESNDPRFHTNRTMPLDESLTSKVRDGLWPAMLADTASYPLAASLPCIESLDIRSYVCVPVLRSDGSLFGMFTCVAHHPIPNLSPRDLKAVAMFARLASKSLNGHLDQQNTMLSLRQQIIDLMEQRALEIHFQPVVSLRSGRVRAVEALTRIDPAMIVGDGAGQNVQWWFNQARATHMQVPFELNAIQMALTYLPFLPENVYLSVNVSPATLQSHRFRKTLADVPPNRLFVELTEHVEITQTRALMDQLSWLRSRRIGFAIDDVGAGYAGLSTMIDLRPNVIKLDRTLVCDIHTDQAKQALVRAMFEFADSAGAFMIAEGVESIAEHDALRKLGVRLAQGYYYCRPKPAFEFIDSLNQQASGSERPR